MDSPKPPILSPITPRLNPRAQHLYSDSPRSPFRERLTDDLLSDLSPSTTLEAFTNSSGKLRASIEAASESERAFGIRATLASKKIQEWVNELSGWSWPAEGGFEVPPAKRRRTSDDTNPFVGETLPESEYIGSLPTKDFLQYEMRVEEIREDMDDLNVEDIKQQVLSTHSGRSRPSSSHSSSPVQAALSSYTKIDDFTAVVTATVLQSLPNLSKLMRLMDVWSIRLAVLKRMPPLLTALDDAEVALKSGWNAIQDNGGLTRETLDVMKEVLQEKVTRLGQDLDFMLDILEGRPDTLPDVWLDRMEAIEADYGAWVVAGDRKINEEEWARMAKALKEEQDAQKVKEAKLAEAERSRAEEAVGEARELEEEQTTGRDVVNVAGLSEEVKHLSDKPQNGVFTPEASEASQREALKNLEHSEISTRDNTAQRLSDRDAQLANGRSALSEVVKRDADLDPEDHHAMPIISNNSNAAMESNIDDCHVDPIESQPSLSSQDRNSTSLVGSATDNDVPSTESTPQIQDLEPLEERQPVFQTDGSESHRPSISSRQTTESRSEMPQPHNVSSPLNLDSSLAIQALEASLLTQERNPSTPSPKSPKSPSRFSHAIADIVRRSSSRGTTSEQTPQSPLSLSIPRVDDAIDACRDPDHLQKGQTTPLKVPNTFFEEAKRSSRLIDEARVASVSTTSGRKSPISDDAASGSAEIKDTSLLDTGANELTKTHSRSSSLVHGYTSAEPTPEIHEAEPAEYFRPKLSPIKSPRLMLTDDDEPMTPTAFRRGRSTANVVEMDSPSDKFELTGATNARASSESVRKMQSTIASQDAIEDGDDTQPEGYFDESSFNSSLDDISTPVTSHNSSLPMLNTVEKQLSHSRPQSSSSDVATVTGALSGPGTPVIGSSPFSGEIDSYPEDYDQSPTAGRVGMRLSKSPDLGPSASPSIPMPKQRALPRPASPVFSTSDPNDLDASLASIDAPIFDNVDVSEAPIASSPTRASDDQLQQQISSILESIPTKIHLTSEPSAHKSGTIRVKKTRPSFTPSVRSSSSLSNYSRAPTPSFLLSPAYAQPKSSRPARSSSSNPEIKLYHLSRSTGEAPIKLFVRLVGEHGERVMVRVGGGWADLGEYLKEYASHHGRRSGKEAGEDKVEIQDLPSSNRAVSNGSTIRGSPGTMSRPTSSLDTRTGSTLSVRKTRKSLGESSLNESMRSPSTPLPAMPNRSFGETPPSQRSTSRLSWTEDDSSLGLAGPKSKKVAISERDQEWVESMKEKVRQASAEKDKERARGASFGELDKVGGTKRLFRKSDK